MLHLTGTIKAILPYEEKIELSPIGIDDDDTCHRTVTISGAGCRLILILSGPAPKALAVSEVDD